MDADRPLRSTVVEDPAATVRERLAAVDPVPGAPKPDPVLVVDGVRKSFGGLVAVDVDHLEIQRGAITALIGPNGAGKSTLFNLITGFDRPEQGRWTFNGQEMRGLPSYRIAGHGMVRSFQLTKALARLTVRENVKLAAQDQRGERLVAALLRPLWTRQESQIDERADALLARFGLGHMRDEFAGTLSGGQRKLLDMARALMTDPHLICLDEPMAGVNPVLTQSLLEHMTSLRDEGMSVLFVEHDMAVVMEISDWIVVLGEGAVIAEGPPQTVAANPAVIDAYLGTGRATPHAPAPIAADDETGRPFADGETRRSPIDDEGEVAT